MDTNKPVRHGETNPDVSFDSTDLSARGVLIFFAVLAVGAILVHFVVYGMYKGYSAIAAKADPEQSPLVKVEPPPEASVLQNTQSVHLEKFGGVPLQFDDAGDMQNFLRVQEAELHSAAWRDGKGNVHLPIEAAMSNLTQPGKLPVRANAAKAPVNYPGAGSAYSGIPELYKVETAAPSAEEGAKPEGSTAPDKSSAEKPAMHKASESMAESGASK